MNDFNVHSFLRKKQHAINNSKTVKCVRVSFIKSYLMLSYLVVKMFLYLKRPDISALKNTRKTVKFYNPTLNTIRN